MFVDAKKIEPGAEFSASICVIGAGAAGITLAREFIGSPTDVILLESGGLEYSSDTQALARGKIVGSPYFELEGERVRFFGGCTDHWGGECRPLDSEDFAARAWIPHSGWPIGLAALEPFYPRAAKIVEIGPYDEFLMTDWRSVVRERPGVRPIEFEGGNVVPRVFQNSPPTRFGTRYRADLETARNVKVLLNANFTGFDTDETQRNVNAVNVACLGGPNFKVKARVFVLATGAIENARLLLTAAGPSGKGFGNDHDQVGRYFQEHVAHEALAKMVPAVNEQISDYKKPGEGTVAAAFTEVAQRERELPNFTIYFDPQREGSESSAVRSFKAIVGGIRERNLPDHLLTHLSRVMTDLPAVARYATHRLSTPDEAIGYFEIGFVMEQIPNPDSRVRLGRERDALGLPLTELDWHLTDLDRQLMLRALDHTAREIGARGVGRVKILIPEDGGDWMSRIYASHHPMGTTRMHADPRFGVVDPNCRVHGMTNLYVAGSSVFTTAGAASPTYSLVAFAIRLADYLKQQAA